MSDMIGVVEQPVTVSATVKDMPDVPAGAESVASEPDKTGQDQAGGSQESSESGSAESQASRQRGPTKLDTIRELRSKLRERDQQHQENVGRLSSRVEELEKLIASGKQATEPRKRFWDAPEEVLDERITSHLSELEKRMLSKIEQRQVQDQETSEWKQETSEAAKFIQAQKGINPEDEDDIAEIVRSTPAMQNMRPMDRAKYAMFLWKEERGIHDATQAKARASSVTVGSAPSAGGVKMWTESEIEAEMSKFPQNPGMWTEDQKKKFDALDNEIRKAYREKRVKK